MIKIFIENSLATAGKNIYIVDEQRDRRLVAKPIELEFAEIKPGTEVKPTLFLNWNNGQEFLQALSKALSEAHVQPPEQPFIAGKLAATETHLEDMRKLVFERKKTK